ncbi:hypothetical protein [Mastigocoleus testarum]|uniref:CPBP family intramembrane metalloprotease n=1 Tax=Mastigocoleus testarum BC008 TaxID=371196 RepID=A0A0V7ZL14_9CYAN|nr:hypothetical protein [Mastigocoleus testarum]KST65229.1 hypothetical protein BC008_20760 [Mastigocoleus testarum BC008]
MMIETSLWVYWLFCLLAMILVISNRKYIYSLLSPDSESSQDKGYVIFMILGWLVTLAVSIAYVLFTRKYETGSYNISNLITFSILNGILEQFMFIFWFLLGCYVAIKITPSKPKLTFTFGYISYAIFSGLIHALFWVQVLPSHKPVTVIMALGLGTMSLIWMWLAWRHRAIMAIIAMHIVIDFITVGHLNFAWFEPFQLI